MSESSTLLTVDAEAPSKQLITPPQYMSAKHGVKMNSFVILNCAVAVLLEVFCSAEHTNDPCPQIVANDNTTQYDLVAQLTHPCRYDANIRPSNIHGGPLNVSSRMYVFSLQSTQTAKLQFVVQCLIQFRWQDTRLVYHNLTQHKELAGQSPMLSMIWTPHIFLSNEKETQHRDEMVSILPHGDVLFTSRIKTTILCLTKEGNFPFDHQDCRLILDSWRYNSKHLALQWEVKEPVMMPIGTPSITEYKLLDMRTTTSENFFTDHIRMSHSGASCTNKAKEEGSNAYTQDTHCDVYSYSSLSVSLVLAREFGFYFWDYYMPSVLVVILSWMTFWIEPDIVPARVWIATCTMLTFFALGAMNSTVPKLTQFKTHDIWFIGCTLFILFSLIEFAFVNIVHRQELKHIELKKPTSKYILKSSLKSEKVPWKQQQVQRSNSCPSSPELRKKMKRLATTAKQQMREEKALSVLDLAMPLTENFKPYRRTQIRISETPVEPIQMTNHEMANWIDKRSRIVFPLAFLVFNAFYWSIMLI